MPSRYALHHGANDRWRHSTTHSSDCRLFLCGSRIEIFKNFNPTSIFGASSALACMAGVRYLLLSFRRRSGRGWGLRSRSWATFWEWGGPGGACRSGAARLFSPHTSAPLSVGRVGARRLGVRVGAGGQRAPGWPYRQRGPDHARPPAGLPPRSPTAALSAGCLARQGRHHRLAPAYGGYNTSSPTRIGSR